jgi:hypothetical protein
MTAQLFALATTAAIFAVVVSLALVLTALLSR